MTIQSVRQEYDSLIADAQATGQRLAALEAAAVGIPSLVQVGRFPIAASNAVVGGQTFTMTNFVDGSLSRTNAGNLMLSGNSNQDAWAELSIPATIDGTQSAQVVGPWRWLTGPVQAQYASRGAAQLADGNWIATRNDEYNATHTDRPCIYDGSAWRRMAPHHDKCAGYLHAIGGDRFLCGLTPMSTDQGSSWGPVAFEFAWPAPDPVPTTEHIFYPQVAPHPTWNQRGDIRGVVLVGPYAIFFGRLGLNAQRQPANRDMMAAEIWYGPSPADAPNGQNSFVPAGTVDPSGGGKGWHATGGFGAYHWIYDTRTQPWSQVREGLLDDVLGIQPADYGRSRIAGATMIGSRIYVSLGGINATKSGRVEIRVLEIE